MMISANCNPELPPEDSTSGGDEGGCGSAVGITAAVTGVALAGAAAAIARSKKRN